MLCSSKSTYDQEDEGPGDKGFPCAFVLEELEDNMNKKQLEPEKSSTKYTLDIDNEIY